MIQRIPFRNGLSSILSPVRREPTSAQILSFGGEIAAPPITPSASTDASDLWRPFLDEADSDNTLSITLSYNARNGRRTITLTGTTGTDTPVSETNVPCNHTQLLEQVVQVLVPGAILQPSRCEPIANPASEGWVDLHPTGRMLYRPTKQPQPSLAYSETLESTGVVLPAARPSETRLQSLCRLLKTFRHDIAVRLRFRPYVLSAATQRVLAAKRVSLGSEPTYSEVEAVLNLKQAYPDGVLLSAYLQDNGGIRVELAVRSSKPLADSARDAICGAVFGVGSSTLHADTKMNFSNILPKRIGCLSLCESITASVSEFSNVTIPVFRAPSEGGTTLGTWAGGRVAISERDRCRHVAIIGATGTGKSTLMLNMLAEDMKAGKGVLLIDPHGDLFQFAKEAVPEERKPDTIIADLSDPSNSFTFNVLGGGGGAPHVERNIIVSSLLRIFKQILWPEVQEAFGPMFELYYRNTMLLLMDSMGERATIDSFERVFQDDEFRRSLVERCTDTHVKRFWQTTAAKATRSEMSLTNISPYIICKFAPFTSNAHLKPILASAESSLDIQAVIDEQKICLVNLSKGIVGQGSAALVGALIVLRLIVSAQKQARLPEDQRQKLAVYLDEYQTYASDVLAEAIEECRKYGLQLVMANQSFTQIDGGRFKADIARSILANVANLICFRTGNSDRAYVEDHLGLNGDTGQLAFLPDYTAIGRLLESGRPTAPLKFCTNVAMQSW